MSSENEKQDLLKPKNDVVFQSLFTKNNEKITKAFIEALIGRKVKNIEINNEKELQRERPEDKLGILDLQLDIDEKEKLDVEVQLIERDNLAERILYYFSRLYGETVKRGKDYIEGQRVMLIAIVDYGIDLTKEIDNYETQWKLRETKNPQLVLTDKEEIIILELEKVRKAYEKCKEDKKAQWMLFLDDPNTKEVREIMEKNEDIKDAVVTVHEMSEDEKLRRLAELREKAIMDEKAIRRAGYKRGMEAGEKNQKIEIANSNKKVAIFVDMDGTIAVYNVYPEDKVVEKMGEEYNLLEPIDYVLNILKEINQINNAYIYILSLSKSAKITEEKKLWLKKYVNFIDEKNWILIRKELGEYNKENRDFAKAQKMKEKLNEYDHLILIDDDHKVLKETQKMLGEKVDVFHISGILI